MRVRLALLFAATAWGAIGASGHADDTAAPSDRMIDAKLAKADAEKKAPPGKADLPVLPGTTAMCIDQEIADRLAIKRKRRGAVDRVFVKQGRHEVSAGGGYYASDLL